jgi:hypothetical protein
MIQFAVLAVHNEPPLISCYNPLRSAYITWRAATDPMLWSTAQCLHYMTSHHWSYVMIHCAVFTLHDEPPPIPCYDPLHSAYITWRAPTDPIYDPLHSAYITWRATTDPMLWSTAQCLHYMTSHHWSHVMIHCAVPSLHSRNTLRF